MILKGNRAQIDRKLYKTFCWQSIAIDRKKINCCKQVQPRGFTKTPHSCWTIFVTKTFIIQWSGFYQFTEIGYPGLEVTGSSKVTMSYTNVVSLNGTNNFCKCHFSCYGGCKLVTRIRRWPKGQRSQCHIQMLFLLIEQTTFVGVIFYVMGSVNWIPGILTRKEVTSGQTEYGVYIFRLSGTTFVGVVLKSVWWISSYWQDRRQTDRRQTDDRLS